MKKYVILVIIIHSLDTKQVTSLRLQARAKERGYRDRMFQELFAKAKDELAAGYYSTGHESLEKAREFATNTQLKEADQLARQKELEENSLDLAEKEPEQKKDAGENHGAAAWQTQEDIYGETGGISHKKPKSEAPASVDISTWFDVAQFLKELKPHINKMYGRQFFAFSMSNGYVYFQAKVLEDIARQQAEKAGCMEIATMAKRDKSMRNVLFTIVHQLRTKHEVIADGLIKKEFFGGYFSVTRKIGKPMKGFYTPFHAEPFGSLAEMEHTKPKMLKDIIKVSPYTE